MNIWILNPKICKALNALNVLLGAIGIMSLFIAVTAGGDARYDPNISVAVRGAIIFLSCIQLSSLNRRLINLKFKKGYKNEVKENI